MLLAFHQPNYLPNLGFFYKMAQVDLFVIASNLQFVRREWQNRAKIMGPGGDLWLTVPVLGSNRQMIREAKINNATDWRRKHRATLSGIYGKSADPGLLDRIVSNYDHECDRLVDFNLRFIVLLKDLLRVPTKLVVDEEVGGKKENLLINICKKYGADTYLSGLGGRSYMDDAYVAEIGKENITHAFVERNVTAEYPYSSAHYLLTAGVERSCQIIGTS